MRQKQKYLGIAYDNDEQRAHYIHVMASFEDQAEQKVGNIFPDFLPIAVFTAEELLTQALDLMRADPAEIEKYAAKLEKANNA